MINIESHNNVLEPDWIKVKKEKVQHKTFFFMVCLSLPREVDTGDFISIVSNFYGIKHYCSNGLGERERERKRRHWSMRMMKQENDRAFKAFNKYLTHIN